MATAIQYLPELRDILRIRTISGTLIASVLFAKTYQQKKQRSGFDSYRLRAICDIDPNEFKEAKEDLLSSGFFSVEKIEDEEGGEWFADIEKMEKAVLERELAK